MIKHKELLSFGEWIACVWLWLLFIISHILSSGIMCGFNLFGIGKKFK